MSGDESSVTCLDNEPNTAPFSATMLTTKVLLFIGLAALAASADVDLSKKKVIWGNGLSPHISIKSVTKSTPKFTVTRRDDWTSKCTGYDACNSKANDGLKVDSVYEVGYEDGVWLPVCLCAGYVTDAKEMASLFAYVSSPHECTVIECIRYLFVSVRPSTS